MLTYLGTRKAKPSLGNISNTKDHVLSHFQALRGELEIFLANLIRGAWNCGQTLTRVFLYVFSIELS